jgi:hypothetical protein
VKQRQLDLFPGGSVSDTGTTVHSRATTRHKRLRETPAPKPWLCTVLAVDTASRSGWALSRDGALRDSGEVETLNEAALGLIVRNAVELSEGTASLVLVLETPWGGSAEIVSALGAARERWSRAWRAHGLTQRRVVLVSPSTWRAAVLGGKWASARRELVRAHEQRVARALVGYDVGADEAPAILIARWAAHTARVGRAIGPRGRRASLRAWLKGGSL